MALARTTLRGRLGAVLIVFLGLVAVSAVVSAVMVRSWSHTIDARGEMRNAARDVSDLKLAYSDQETGVRGYQISSDDAALAPYRDGSVLARRLLERLKERPIDQIDLAGLTLAVEQAGEDWTTKIAVPTIEHPGSPPPAEQSVAAFDQVRAALDALDAAVTGELNRLIHRTDRVRATTFGVLTASFVTALLGTLLVTFLFRRWVTQPLATISTAARRLGEDETFEVPDFPIVELQDVADAIRSMQVSLASARDRAVVAYEGLAQSAVLALHVRSQLANELGDLPGGWEVDSLLEPAAGVVAGDCYDLGLLDPRTIYLVMVDVTGHGAVAALDALKAKSQLRAALRSRLEPGAAIEWISRERHDDPESDLMTAIVARIDVDSGQCRYANAGHPPMLVVGGGATESMPPTGPLIGAFASTWETRTVTIPVGSSLVVYTDGVTDTIGDDRQRFGEERLVEVLASADGPAAAVAAVRDSVEAFRVGTRSDDVTLLVLARNPTDEAGDPVAGSIATVQA